MKFFPLRDALIKYISFDEVSDCDDFSSTNFENRLNDSKWLRDSE